MKSQLLFLLFVDIFRRKKSKLSRICLIKFGQYKFSLPIYFHKGQRSNDYDFDSLGGWEACSEENYRRRYGGVNVLINHNHLRDVMAI